MRFTIVRLGEVFVKARQSVLPTKGVAASTNLKVAFANGVLASIVIYGTLLFGAPTPDVRHDIRCALFSEFSRYSRSERQNYLGLVDEQRIRSFQFLDGKLKRSSDFGPKNEDIFRFQDYKDHK